MEGGFARNFRRGVAKASIGGVNMSSAKLIVAYPKPTDVEAFEALYQKEHVPMAVANLRVSRA